MSAEYKAAKATIEFVKVWKKNPQKLVDMAARGCPMLIDWSSHGSALDTAHDLISNLFDDLLREAEDIVIRHDHAEMQKYEQQESTLYRLGAY